MILKAEFIKDDLYYLNNLNIYNKEFYSIEELKLVRNYSNLYEDFIASNLEGIDFLTSLNRELTS